MFIHVNPAKTWSEDRAKTKSWMCSKIRQTCVVLCAMFTSNPPAERSPRLGKSSSAASHWEEYKCWSLFIWADHVSFASAGRLIYEGKNTLDLLWIFTATDMDTGSPLNPCPWFLASAVHSSFVQFSDSRLSWVCLYLEMAGFKHLYQTADTATVVCYNLLYVAPISL